MKSIHTLDARNNVMLDVVQEMFGLSPIQMHSVLQRERDRLEKLLESKHIRYDALRTALIPSVDKRDVAFAFDTMSISESWYGYSVFEQLIPLFNRDGNHSVLVGDYIGNNEQQDVLFDAFTAAIKPARLVDYRYSNQFFIVYISNVSETVIKAMDENLRSYHGYAGYADRVLTPGVGHAESRKIGGGSEMIGPRWQGRIIPTSSSGTRWRCTAIQRARRSPRSLMSSASVG